MSNAYPDNVSHYQLPLPEPERLAKAPLPPHPLSSPRLKLHHPAISHQSAHPITQARQHLTNFTYLFVRSL